MLLLFFFFLSRKKVCVQGGQDQAGREAELLLQDWGLLIVSVAEAGLQEQGQPSPHLCRQICLLGQEAGRLFIDMVQGEWVKSTNEIKAVLFFCEHADHVATIDKTQER